MASTTEPFLGLTYGWDGATENFAAGMDADLQRIGAVTQIGVKSKSLDISDIVPTANDRYIVPVGATGVFAGKDNQVAYYRNATWFFIVPRAGFSARVETPAGRWDFTAAGVWEQQAAPVTGSGFADAPADGKRYFRKDNGWVAANETDAFAAVETVTTTTYTLIPADRGKVKNFTNASGCVVTVPMGMSNNATVYLRRAVGAGGITVAPASGVTIDTAGSLSLRVEKSIAALMFLFTDNPTLTGDLA